jgi:hypothetical protein
VRHPELLVLISTAIAVEIAHLRWIVYTQWKCRSCSETHIECPCKPVWLKRLL